MTVNNSVSRNMTCTRDKDIHGVLTSVPDSSMHDVMRVPSRWHVISSSPVEQGIMQSITAC